MPLPSPESGWDALHETADILDRDEPGWREPGWPLSPWQIEAFLAGALDDLQDILDHHALPLRPASAQRWLALALGHPGGDALRQMLHGLPPGRVHSFLADVSSTLHRAIAATPPQLFRYSLDHRFEGLGHPIARADAARAMASLAQAAGIRPRANADLLRRLMAGVDELPGEIDHLSLGLLWYAPAPPLLRAAYRAQEGGWTEIAWATPHLQVNAPATGMSADVVIRTAVVRRLEPPLCRVITGYTPLRDVDGVRIAHLGEGPTQALDQRVREAYATPTRIRALDLLERPPRDHGLPGF
jgi:hypothetical protein